MNLLNRLNLMRRGVEALERIAVALEWQMLQSRNQQKGLFGFKPGDNPKEGAFYSQTDEEFASFEEEEKKHPDLVKQEEALEKMEKSGRFDISHWTPKRRS